MPVELPAETPATFATDASGVTVGRPIADREGYASILAPAEALDEIGRLGHYRILQLLGQGGMGFVFRAEDAKLRREVAIKVMRPENARSTVARQRFEREALAAAALKNDHVISLYSVEELRGALCIVMPLLHGETLHQRMEREKSLPPTEVIRIGREVAEGLAAAHEVGLIHRDIKPANLWLEAPNGRVKILDFGLARRFDHSDLITSTGEILGSPAYMAPEQAAAGESIDNRADLFSLGCVLYQAATGRKPFPGNDVMGILNALANHVPRPAASVNPAVPESLSRLIGRLLEKKPERRPGSAREVAEAFAALPDPAAAPCAESPPVDATHHDSATLVDRTRGALNVGRARRRQTLLIIAVAILVLAIVIIMAMRPAF
jgi:serine/threonine protein kinase